MIRWIRTPKTSSRALLNQTSGDFQLHAGFKETCLTVLADQSRPRTRTQSGSSGVTFVRWIPAQESYQQLPVRRRFERSSSWIAVRKTSGKVRGGGVLPSQFRQYSRRDFVCKPLHSNLDSSDSLDRVENTPVGFELPVRSMSSPWSCYGFSNLTLISPLLSPNSAHESRQRRNSFPSFSGENVPSSPSSNGSESS